MVYRLFERESALVPHPPPEEVGREAGVAKLASVRACVRESEYGERLGQQRGDRTLVGVRQGDAKPGLQAGGDREVQSQVERVDALLGGDFGHQPSLELRPFGTGRDLESLERHDQRPGLRLDRCALGEFALDRRTEGRVGENLPLAFCVRRTCPLERVKPIERERRRKLELHHQRPTRDLRIDG